MARDGHDDHDHDHDHTGTAMRDRGPDRAGDHPHHHAGHRDHRHGHRHDHGRSGHRHHHEAPARFDRAFAIGIILNLGFVVVEASYGFVAHSVALLADAGHNLSDVLGLAVAWGALALGRTAPTKRFTFGLGRSSILAALLNALLLLVALGAVVLASVQRLIAPVAVAGLEVSAVAAIGIVINLATAALFARGRHGDLNLRGAFLHMAGDAAVSAGVVVSGLIIWRTGVRWLDPVVSIVIAALIFWQTWAVLRESVEMSLDAVPRAIDLDAVRGALAALPGVARVHHVHIWPMSTTDAVLTAHLVTPGGHPGDDFLDGARAMLARQYRIGHATLQVEIAAEGACTLPG